MADRMDLKPAQLMHNIRLGREQEVLHSRAIWLCLGCETCTARCPQEVHPAEAIAAARALAIKKGIRPRVKEVGIYYQGFINNMRMNGKIHDASIAAIAGLRTGRILKDLPLAWKLMIRGRIKPPPLPFGGRGFIKLHQRIIEIEKETWQ